MNTSKSNDSTINSFINKSQPILVTGANGYLASWLVKMLLEDGHTVHAAVRSPDNDKKVGHLQALAEKASGTLKLFQADLLTPSAYFEAMQGCELVFHTASPFILDAKDPQKELVEPAVFGVENVLESANRTASVKRVVMTSSCAAMYTDCTECAKTPNGYLTEDDWNTTASLDYQPYYYSKTLAERKAWEIADSQDRWDLVTINPSAILGPTLNTGTLSESVNMMLMLGDGQLKMGAPRMGIGVVDVRDVAKAHLLAGFTPSAQGRYITSGHNTDLVELGQVLAPKYGKQFPLPKRALPKWLLMIVGPMINPLFTRRYIKHNINVPWKGDNAKIKRELGMQFNSLQSTMEDAFQVLIDAGLLKAK